MSAASGDRALNAGTVPGRFGGRGGSRARDALRLGSRIGSVILNAPQSLRALVRGDELWLGSVLQAVYLIFSEGSFASSGDQWMRTELADEALRLGRVLVRLAPEPEVFGLLALMELTAARFPARTDSDGEPVLLEDQDRRLWDVAAIRRGPRGARARGVGGARSRRVRAAGLDRGVPCGRAVGR